MARPFRHLTHVAARDHKDGHKALPQAAERDLRESSPPSGWAADPATETATSPVGQRAERKDERIGVRLHEDGEVRLQLAHDGPSNSRRLAITACAFGVQGSGDQI